MSKDRRRPILRGAIVVTVLALCGLLVACATSQPDIPYATLQQRYASPASRFLDLGDGLVVHYRDEGPRDAPVIVLVHGFGASLHAWEPWVRRLPDFRVISLDLPGHGLTQAPAGYRATTDGFADLIDTVTRRLDVTRYVVAGNSMGGAAAWNLAMRHPERLRGLVLVDAAGWPGPGRQRGRPAFAGFLATPVGSVVANSIDLKMILRRGLAMAYDDPAMVTPALLDRYAELARAPGHRRILPAIESRPGRPVTPASFAALRTPTLVMHGEADRLIPVADGRAFAAAIPGARLVTYPGAGHLPMETLPDRTIADLRPFLAGLAP